MPLPDVIDIPPGDPPCMKGLWKKIGDTQIISGSWAMSQKAHTGLNAIKSKFEITGVENLERGVDSPRGGAFIGYFDYQDSLVPRRIEDKGYLAFEKNRIGGKNISGEFKNEFGRFAVCGTMSGTGRVEMFRIQKDLLGAEDAKSTAVQPERPAASSTTSVKTPNSSATSVSSRNKKSLPCKKGVKRPASSELKSESIPPLKRIFSKMPVRGGKILKEFVNKFRKKQHTRSFVIPVKNQLSPADYEAYLRVIEHPIDMGEISKRLDSGAYDKPDDFFAELRLMVNNALKFHKFGTDFHALSLNIQKYIEDNIVQIQRRLTESNGTSTHPQPKKRIVEQNIKGGLLEASCVKAKPLSEKEKEDLASSVSELFKDKDREIDRAYSWVAWKFISSFVPSDQQIRNNGVVEIEVDKLQAVPLRQLQTLLEDWREARKGDDEHEKSEDKEVTNEVKSEEDKREGEKQDEVLEIQENGPEKVEENEEVAVEVDVNNDKGEEPYSPVLHKDEEKEEVQTATKEDRGHSDDGLAPMASTPNCERSMPDKDLAETPSLTPHGESGLYVISEPAGDKSSSKLDVMNVDAWSEEKESPVDGKAKEDSGERKASSAQPADGWESARREKLDKEKRELQRKTQEAELVAKQREKEAKRAEALALEATKARKEREREAESKREAEKKKKEEEAAMIAAKREEDQKRRDDMEQEIDLDEVRGDAELMAMMNSSLG